MLKHIILIAIAAIVVLFIIIVAMRPPEFLRHALGENGRAAGKNFSARQ